MPRGGAIPPIHRKGNPWRYLPGGPNFDRTGIPNKPYRLPSKERQRYVQKRTGLTPAQQADWCLAVVDVARLTRKHRFTVRLWMTRGRRRYTEVSWHKLPSEDYGIGDESRFYTRMQDLVGYAVDWKIPLYILTPKDELMLERARVALLLTRGYDPLPLLSIIRNIQESEDTQ